MSMYGIVIDPQSRQSQYQQLVDQIRHRIHEGKLVGRLRLASTRDLAQSLGLARSVVLEAIDQLKMEGYLETRQGSGTYVGQELVWSGSSRRTLERGTGFESLPSAESKSSSLSFAPGMPDLSLFPKRSWTKCYQAAVEYASESELGYTSPSGRNDLRMALARHLFVARGMTVEPESIVITAGSSQAISILTQTFRNCRVLMEDPQAPFIRRIFQGLNCNIEYAPADEKGLLCEALPRRQFDLIYVTPAHQFPLGGTLAADRRIQLLNYAREHGSWIIEDDYDSEFRYDHRPVSPLQTMAPERVIYVGTFSKNLSPALRLGFMVMPKGLMAKVKSLKLRWDLWTESLQQKTLAIFMTEGYLDRHIRRALQAYRKKNVALLRMLEQQLPTWEILGASTGMHLVIRPTSGGPLRSSLSDVSEQLFRRGFLVELVTLYCQMKPAFADGLILAYGNRTFEQLESVVEALASVAQHEFQRRDHTPR